MTLLDAHLDQIEACSQTIAELPFHGPKIFTNALLNCPDITTLIRDTEAHERALFSIAPPETLPINKASRRTTTFGGPDRSHQATRKQSAVAAVLGGDLAERIRRERVRESQLARRHEGAQRDDIDVEILLQGAEKLCAVYPIPGAQGRIAALRNRNNKVLASISRYEELAVEQTAQLAKLNRSTSFAPGDETADIDLRQLKISSTTQAPANLPMTQEELLEEESTIAELERKKKMLEERVDSMEKDLGGLMR